MCIRIGLNCIIKGVEHQGIIITVTDTISYDSSVVQIENCT